MRPRIVRAHHTTAVTLVGLPTRNLDGCMDVLRGMQEFGNLVDAIIKNRPEGIVVQVDPSPLMYFQRKVAQTQKGTEPMSVSDRLAPFPITMDETRVNFLKIDGMEYFSQGKKYNFKHCTARTTPLGRPRGHALHLR